MKKTSLIIYAAIILFLSVTTASADSLSSMTDDELLSMYQQIQTILLSRSNEYSIALNAGRYTVGKDFPSGIYRLECKGAYSSSTVNVYSTVESTNYSDWFIMGELYNSSVVGKLELNDGNVLEIKGSTIDLTCYSPAHISVSSEASGNTSNESTATSINGSFVVAPGKYHVGSEIAPGTYRVVCDDPYGFAVFNLYDSKKSILPSYDTIVSKLFGNPEIGKLELKNGNYVEIKEGSVTFYPYLGIGK